MLIVVTTTKHVMVICIMCLVDVGRVYLTPRWTAGHASLASDPRLLCRLQFISDLFSMCVPSHLEPQRNLHSVVFYSTPLKRLSLYCRIIAAPSQRPDKQCLPTSVRRTVRPSSVRYPSRVVISRKLSKTDPQLACNIIWKLARLRCLSLTPIS